MPPPDSVPKNDARMMRLVLFWVFTSIFILVCVITLLSVFFGLGSPTPDERSLLLKGFIGEVGAAIIALFYSLFGLRREVAPTETEKLKADVAEKLKDQMQEVNRKVEHVTAGTLMVQGDVESSQGHIVDAAISYIHASSHAVRSGDESLAHEVLKELLDVKLKAVTKAHWTSSDELQENVTRLIDRLPQLYDQDKIAYAILGLRNFRASMNQ